MPVSASLRFEVQKTPLPINRKLVSGDIEGIDEEATLSLLENAPSLELSLQANIVARNSRVATIAKISLERSGQKSFATDFTELHGRICVIREIRGRFFASGSGPSPHHVKRVTVTRLWVGASVAEGRELFPA